MLTGNNAKNGLTTVVYNMLHDASNYVLDTTHKQSFTLFALLPTNVFWSVLVKMEYGKWK